MTLPRFTIESAGRRLAASLQEHLTTLRLSRVASAPAQLELTWQAGVGSELPVFELGAQLSLSAESRSLFSGAISKLEISKERDGHAVLSLRAYDALEGLRRRARARLHSGGELRATLAELVESLGLQLDGFEDAPPVAGEAQRGRSDFECLRALSLGRGWHFQLEGKTLRGFRASPGRARVARAWSDFWTCRCELNGRRAHERVTVFGSSLSGPGSFRGEARGTGAACSPAGAARERMGGTLHSDAEAAALARAWAEHGSAASDVFRGTRVPGELDFRPGVTLDLEGIPGRSAASFVLMQVTHVFDGQNGFYTEVSSEPASEPSDAANRSPVSVGQVREIDARGRVRAYFPSYDAESDWLRVVVAGAGKQRGLAFLPDVGDEVVALSPDGDPLHGVVLGGLWEEGPADAGVALGKRRRSEWRLGKQRFSLDLDHDRIETANGSGATLALQGSSAALRAGGGDLHVEDGRGSSLKLTSTESRLTSAQPLVIEAPGQAITIRAAKIDFEQA